MRLRFGRVCYGADLEGGAPVLVRGVRSRGRIRCERVADRDAASRLEIAGGTPVVACLSVREGFARWIEAPFAGMRKAVRVLPTLLDIQLPFDLDDCVYEFAVVKRGEGRKVRALAVAARAETVQGKLAQLRALGLDPLILDQESLALWTQSLYEIPPDPRSAPAWRVLVYLGRDRTSLVIGRGVEFVDSHSVAAGDAAQIGRLLRPRLQDGAGGVRWMWTGPGAADTRELEERTARLVQEWPGRSTVHAEPETFLARALATRALTAGPLRCNLRRGLWVHPRLAAQWRRRRIRSAALVLGCGFIMCAAGLGLNIRLRQQIRDADATFRALARELAGRDIGGARGEHAQRMVREASAKRQAALRPFRRAFEPSLLQSVTSLTEIAAKEGLFYETLTLSPDQVSVHGAARDWNGPEKLHAHLERQGFDVRLERQEPIADQWVAFKIVPGGARD